MRQIPFIKPALVILLLAAQTLAPAPPDARAQAPGVAAPLPQDLEGVGITEHPDAPIPLDLAFMNEDSQSVRLGDFFGRGRPVLLTLVYYECPMLCTFVLNGVVGSVQRMRWEPGREFEIVTVSFNPAEGPALARAKKESYIDSYGRPEAAGGWHFLTGREPEIRALTQAVGFEYRYDEKQKQFIHTAAIMVATPDGRLSRYLYGVDYDPTTLRLSLLEAADGRIGSPLNRVVLYCYHYDPAAGGYSLVAFRVAQIGAGTAAVALGLLIGSLWLRGRRQRREGLAAGRPVASSGRTH